MPKKTTEANLTPEPKPHPTGKMILAIIAILVVAGGAAFLLMRQRAQKRAEKAKTEIAVQPSAIDNYKKQLPALEKKVRENPGDRASVREYAVALYASGDTEKAKEQYLSEQKMNDKDPVLYNNLGNIYRDSGQYEEAIKSYQKAIELGPQSTTAYVNLAHLYIYTLDKADLGIDVFQTAIENNPDNIEIQNLLGTTYEQMGENDRAKEMFEGVLKKNPDNTAAKAGLERVSASPDR